MDVLTQLFSGASVAHALLIISLVAACGLTLGSLRLCGINLGIAGVLFAGLLFGHYGVTINPQVMEFAREFGLILFVYSIGLQVGPGFIASLRREGLPLNLMAASVVVLGVAITIVVHRVGHLDMLAAVGLYAGGTTNTPSLAAAQQALQDVTGIAGDAATLPSLGYAVAYPFGIIGTILTMLLIRALFRIRPAQEAEAFAQLAQGRTPPLVTKNLTVENVNLRNLPVGQIPGLSASGVVISRVLHEGRLQVAQPELRLHLGDVVLAVGTAEALDALRIVVGKESSVDLKRLPSAITSRRVIVTQRRVLGRSIGEVDLTGRYGVTATRVSRADIEFSATPGLRLQFGDTLILVGEDGAIAQAARALGNSLKQLRAPQLVPVFLGIALGVVLGSWPLHIPGIPAPVRLGLAGGPLVMAMLLSRIGRIGPLVWYMPISANVILREVGIVLFLSCVGLRAGDQFVQVLVHGSGWWWMGASALITLVPLVCVGLVARAVYRLNYVSLCGLLAGSMTDPPALAFAGSATHSDAPSVSYATVYPLVMLLRVVSAQALVLLFVR